MKHGYLFAIVVTLVSAFDVDPLRFKIKAVDTKEHSLVFEKKNANLSVGESGIILSNIGQGIISNSITISKIIDSNQVQAHYDSFNALEQRYLPTPVIAPKVGDEVIVRSFYSRGFIVAPNQVLYDRIKTLFPKITFISSDLMIADVGDKGIVDPSKKGFQEICNIYSVGILIIYASNGINVLDCQSFKILKTQELQNPNPEVKQYPFFARVQAKSFWDFARGKKEYFYEYDKLLQ